MMVSCLWKAEQDEAGRSGIVGRCSGRQAGGQGFMRRLK
jgi:hypothetical protein